MSLAVLPIATALAHNPNRIYRKERETKSPIPAWAMNFAVKNPYRIVQNNDIRFSYGTKNGIPTLTLKGEIVDKERPFFLLQQLQEHLRPFAEYYGLRINNKVKASYISQGSN